MRVRTANLPSELPLVRELFREYEASLDFALDFQGFEQEVAALPGEYAEPGGTILVAEGAGAVAGCVALRALEPTICEMKRMYVRPAHRGRGAGRALAQAVLEAARQRGYRRMRLDTMASMTEAIALYRRLGFRPIEPYRHNPRPDALYFEIEL